MGVTTFPSALTSTSTSMPLLRHCLRRSSPCPPHQHLLRLLPNRHRHRHLHATASRAVIKPFLLADIGEGIREVQIIQWFVQPGARVDQFDKLCEVQSDKAATEITSPFDGVVKKLHYEADETALVGRPLLDIDIQSEITAETEGVLGNGGEDGEVQEEVAAGSGGFGTGEPEVVAESGGEKEEVRGPLSTASRTPHAQTEQQDTKHRSLATPAVRHLTKEFSVNIEDIEGTGKDGRVLKEDVHRHVSKSSQASAAPLRQEQAVEERTASLTPVQMAMFKTMTRSLTIPHFLYTSTIDTTDLTALRQRLNSRRDPSAKLTPLPFVLKAVSLAFTHHPLLNAALDTSDPKKPTLTYRSTHDFGIAIDSPSGLLVPVVRDVGNQSVAQLAQQIRGLSAKAREGKLAAADFKGGTFTVSNIGSIGGGVVAPIIVEPQVAIVGVGRAKLVPAFGEGGELVRREEIVFSWSADHRVVDGAECARAAERVRGYLEGVEEWVLEMR